MQIAVREWTIEGRLQRRNYSEDGGWYRRRGRYYYSVISEWSTHMCDKHWLGATSNNKHQSKI